ncbi:response regulator [Halioglobus sp. HI00S01]|uniref:hybrid sensor histidine kinase/response regulator n=1 Tax=Halioglobus sp. HI00S01 TaxID=1822214 RepID=UPI001E3D81E5|nr:response regulator [Halioglobus sp. HI00S01]
MDEDSDEDEIEPAASGVAGLTPDDVDIDKTFAEAVPGEHEADHLSDVTIPQVERSTAVVFDPLPSAATTSQLSEIQIDHAPENIAFDDVPEQQASILTEFLEDFYSEADIQIERIEDAVSHWEAAPSDPEHINDLRRVLHNLKGMSNAVGLNVYGTLIHNFETLLDSLDLGDVGAESFFAIINIWLDSAVGAFDRIKETTADIDYSIPSRSDTPEEIDQEPAHDGAGNSDHQDNGVGWFIPRNVDFDFVDDAQRGTELSPDFLPDFKSDTDSTLETLQSAVDHWEEAPTEGMAARDSVLRCLHNLKGVARGLELSVLGTLCHNFESLLEAVPSPSTVGERHFFKVLSVWTESLVSGSEAVESTLRDVESEFPIVSGVVVTQSIIDALYDENTVSDTAADDGVTSAVDSLIPSTIGQDDSEEQALAAEGMRQITQQQSVKLSVGDVDQLLNRCNQIAQLGVGGQTQIAMARAASTDALGRLRQFRSQLQRMSAETMRATSASNMSDGGMDALEMDRYSATQEYINILLEGVSDLDDMIQAATASISGAEQSLLKQAFSTSSMNASLRSTRMVPVSRLMPGLKRIVRTTGNDLGKNVRFEIESESGALDRDFYDRVRVVLEHMVRNALDHGIERPEVRASYGKPAAGVIKISARKVGGDFIFKLADDGKGISPDVMREEGIKKGLISSFDEVTDDEALRLIFRKKFSTATEVTQVSGRGVGMDIVIDEVSKMGGHIDIQSTPNEGTVFTFTIPSNISFNGALLVTAGADKYAVPLEGLLLVGEVPADAYFKAMQEGSEITVSGHACEAAYLGTICHGTRPPERSSWGQTIPCLVAGTDGRRLAISVDEIEEALDLVVRSLGAQYNAVPGVAGAATGGSGEVMIALDLNSMVRSLGAVTTTFAEQEEAANNAVTVLVVDDSRTQRTVATTRLKSVGIETCTAENGRVALNTLADMPRLPDAILLDIEMPVMDGLECLAEIRRSQRFSEIPVIMVTSRTGEKHRKLAEDAGANAFLGKPFNFTLLVETLGKLTNQEIEMV